MDRLLADEVFKSDTKLAPRVDDATFLRRVWLDIVGDIPTPEHVTAFLLDPATDKRERVVRELLDDPQYGQNWARYWRDVILYRRIEDRAAIVSNALVESLTEKFNENEPWDKIAAEFITATGDVRENGATAIHHGAGRPHRGNDGRNVAHLPRHSDPMLPSATITDRSLEARAVPRVGRVLSADRRAAGAIADAARRSKSWRTIGRSAAAAAIRMPKVAAAAGAFHARSGEPHGARHADAAQVLSHVREAAVRNARCRASRHASPSG